MDMFKLIGRIALEGASEVSEQMDTITTDAKSLGDRISSAMKSAGEKIEGVGKKLTPVSTALGVVAGASIKTSASFEDGMLKVQSLSGATGAEYEKLKQTAKDYGATTAWSARDVADAMGYMALAGMGAGQIMESTGGMLSLASASGENLATVTDILTDSMTAFGDGADQAGRYADVLATTQAKSNTTVGMLGEAFKYVAPLAGAMGYKLEDVSTSLGLMANAGVKGSMAGTSLSSVLTRLSTNAGASKNSMGALDVLTKQLGVEFYNADGTTRNLSDVMKDLCDATKDLSVEEKTEIAKKIAGQEAMKGLLAIMNQGSGAYEDLEKQIKSSNGSAQEMTTTMESGLGGSLRKMKSALEGVTIELGEAMAPTIEKVAGKISELANWFRNLSPETQTLIGKIIMFGTVLAPILIIVGKVIGFFGTLVGIVTKVHGAFTLVSGAVSSAGGVIALLTNPITIAIAIIGALIAVGVALYKNWDTIKAKCIELKDDLIAYWSALKETVSNKVEELKTNLTNLWTAIKTAVVNKVLELKTDLTNYWTALKQVISDKVNAIKTTVTEKFTALKTSAMEKVNALKTSITTAFNNIKTAIITPIQNAITTVTEKFNSIKEKARNLFSGIVPKLHLSLPHVSVSGGVPPFGIMGKGSLPHFNVTWNKKAMNTPYLFSDPTLFNLNPVNGTASGAGEAGDEVMYGRQNLMRDIGESVAINNGAMEKKLDRLIDMLSMFFPEALEKMDKPIVLDDGTLVSKMAPAMDVELGRLAIRKGRGR